MKQYATYLRVSTQRQGAQGLGISAQRNMCANFIKQNKGKQVQEFMDVESGTHRDRKGLWQAIDYCKKNGCSLVIAKLDRMSRDVEFTFKVINTGIDIHFTDMPVVNSMILGVFAAVAQYEREMVSTRTKQALAVKKARGCKLGAGNEKYKAKIAAKPKNELKADYIKRGKSKTSRYLDSKEVQAFVRVLRACYPEGHEEDVRMWTNWRGINTCRDNRLRILRMMRDYKELCGGEVFKDMDLTDMEAPRLQIQLAHKIHTLKTSVRNYSVYAGIDDADIKGITAEQQDMDMAV